MSRAASLAGQIAWVVLSLATLAVGIVGLSLIFRNPDLIAIPEFRDVISALGIPTVLATAVSFALPVASAAALALAVFVGKRGDAKALLFAYAILGMSVFLTGAPRAIALEMPRFEGPAVAIEVLTLVAMTLVFFLFPDGRFYPRWSAWLAGLSIATVLIVPDVASSLRMMAAHPETVPGPLKATTTALAIGVIGGAVVAQTARYRRRASTIERQQMRWVLLGLASFAVPAGITTVGYATAPGPWIGWVLLAASIASPVFPITVAIALFRYRLYDIDLVINRTLVYGALTGFLGLVYVGAVVGLSQLVPGEDNDPAVAAATLAVAALFAPARRRIQAFVDRRFYRSRYDARRTLEAFGSRLREQVELETLLSDLQAVVRDTLHPSRVGVWVRDSK